MDTERTVAGRAARKLIKARNGLNRRLLWAACGGSRFVAGGDYG
jgi:hypothetical protein